MNAPAPAAAPPRSPAAISLAFLAFAFLALLAALAVLVRRPDLPFASPPGGGSLALAHLLMLGWAAAALFGIAYTVVPVMLAARLHSPRLARAHFLLHAAGLPWLALGLLAGSPADIVIGGGALVAGIVLFALNVMFTATARNRWEPANLTLLAALFWLCVSAVIPWLVANPAAFAALGRDRAWLLAIHHYAAVPGFLWLGTLACALLLARQQATGGARPAGGTWFGLALAQLGLAAAAALDPAATPLAHRLLPGIFFLAGLGFAADLARMIRQAPQARGPALLLAGGGLGGTLVVFAWAAATGTPASAALPAVVAALHVALLGLAARFLPFLVWHLRCAPRAGRRAELPGPTQLARPRGLEPLAIAGLCGGAYFAAGSLASHPAGIQIGAMVLLVAAAWLVLALRPALRLLAYGD
jgi:hypothetical protein